MKKGILLLSIGMLFSTMAIADNENESKKISDVKRCKNVSNVAKSIMTNRQNGISIVDHLDFVDNHFIDQRKKINHKITKKEDETFKYLKEEFVDFSVRAYEKPVWQGDEYRQEAIREFENEIFLECYKSVN